MSRVAAALAMFALSMAAQAHEAETAVCDKNAEMPKVAAATAALNKEPASLDARFALADAWSEQGCFRDAVHVLEEGEEFNPRSQELQTRLRMARSSITEQNYFDGLDKAEKAAEIKRNLLRCTKLADLKACDDALAANPNDPELLVAKADAVVAAGRPADALPIYKRAEANGASAGVLEKIRAAESTRQELLGRCQSGSAASALDACQKALLSGAADEFSIQKRIGALLQASDRAPQALDAYIAASLLNPSDQAVSLAIVALTDSTGRKDALGLAARGSALLALGRNHEALAALKRAQALDPGLPRIKVQLAQAGQAKSVADVGMGERKKSAPVRLAAATAPARTYSNAAEAGRSH